MSINCCVPRILLALLLSAPLGSFAQEPPAPGDPKADPTADPGAPVDKDRARLEALMKDLPDDLDKLEDLYKVEAIRLNEAFSSLEKPPEQPDGCFDKAEAILTKIALTGSRKASYFLIEKCLKESMKHPEVQAEAFEAQRRAIGAIPVDTAAWTDLENRLKRKSDWKERVDIIYALRSHKGETPNKLLLSICRDSNDNVALAAIRTLAARRCIEAIPTIIQIMRTHERKKDRGWLDCRQSLTAITGYDADSASAWAAKWKELEAANFNEKSPRGRDPFYSPTDYIISQSVVMLLDTSSSMALRDPIEGIKPGVDQTTTSTRLPIERTRMTRGKRRMQSLLSTLRKGSKFNIVHFNDRATSWQSDGQLVSVDDGAIDTALDYLEGYRPKGLSKADEGFEVAFRNEKADTIIYMSDGIASDRMGKRVPYLTLLAQIKNLNRHRNVRIFAVSFKGADREFMTRLARAHGGSYQEIP